MGLLLLSIIAHSIENIIYVVVTSYGEQNILEHDVPFNQM